MQIRLPSPDYCSATLLLWPAMLPHGWLAETGALHAVAEPAVGLIGPVPTLVDETDNAALPAPISTDEDDARWRGVATLRLSVLGRPEAAAFGEAVLEEVATFEGVPGSAIAEEPSERQNVAVGFVRSVPLWRREATVVALWPTKAAGTDIGTPSTTSTPSGCTGGVASVAHGCGCVCALRAALGWPLTASTRSWRQIGQFEARSSHCWTHALWKRCPQPGSKLSCSPISKSAQQITHWAVCRIPFKLLESRLMTSMASTTSWGAGSKLRLAITSLLASIVRRMVSCRPSTISKWACKSSSNRAIRTSVDGTPPLSPASQRAACASTATAAASSTKPPRHLGQTPPGAS